MTDHDNPVEMTAIQAEALGSLTRSYSMMSAVIIAQGWTTGHRPSYIQVTVGGKVLGDTFRISRTGKVTRI